MIKNFLVFLGLLGLSSCSYNQYKVTYCEAFNTKTLITISKDENYQELKDKVNGYFESRGYKNVVYEDQKNKFTVFSKAGDFGEPCQIILKYDFKAGENKTRVDLANGNDDIITETEVTDDIQRIADKIKNL